MKFENEGIDCYSIKGLEELLNVLGQPRFRAKQLFEWLYGHGAHSYDEMTNLPATLCETLAQVAPLHVPEVIDKRVSADGTRKYILQLADGQTVETVGIPTREGMGAAGERLTVCVSSQVGCPMACTFCATGQEGFTRNLTPGEMVWQVLTVARDFKQRVSNVVVMGQGEPFLNYENTLAALHILNHDRGPGIGARHITVSTCGILDGIHKFAEVPEQFTLAVSLHCALQDVRNTLMPKCAHISLEALKDALAAYQQTARRRISLEYLMIEGNSTSEEAFDALIAFCQGLHVHINLLPINETDGSTLRPCNNKRIRAWADALAHTGIEASVRTSRGADICGACGQLKNR